MRLAAERETNNMPRYITNCTPGFQHCFHRVLAESIRQYLCCWCGQSTPTQQTLGVAHQHGKYMPASSIG